MSIWYQLVKNVFAILVFQLIVSPLISRNYNIGGGYFNFNVYTVPGFVGLVMALLDGIAIFIWLQDVDAGHENEDQATEAIGMRNFFDSLQVPVYSNRCHSL